MISINNFINGEFVPPNSYQYLDVYEPATGLIYSNVADSNSNDVENAYQSAQSAFKFWSGISVEERAGYLNKIADGIESRLDEFAEYESRDTGKPISLAKSIDFKQSSPVLYESRFLLPDVFIAISDITTSIFLSK